MYQRVDGQKVRTDIFTVHRHRERKKDMGYMGKRVPNREKVGGQCLVTLKVRVYEVFG